MKEKFCFLTEIKPKEALTQSGLDYLYIYGANNHNENNIGKLSFESRIEWVKNNYNKIINLDHEFIKKSEKSVYISFILFRYERITQ